MDQHQNHSSATDAHGAPHLPDHPEVESHKGTWFVRKVHGSGPYHASFRIVRTRPSSDSSDSSQPTLGGDWRDLERAYDTPQKAEDAALEAAKTAIDGMDLVR